MIARTHPATAHLYRAARTHGQGCGQHSLATPIEITAAGWARTCGAGSLMPCRCSSRAWKLSRGSSGARCHSSATWRCPRPSHTCRSRPRPLRAPRRARRCHTRCSASEQFARLHGPRRASEKPGASYRGACHSPGCAGRDTGRTLHSLLGKCHIAMVDECSV